MTYSVYSHHSYNKPRLLGQLKSEYDYLNICAYRSCVNSTSACDEKKVISKSWPTCRMTELRESLRQAALINIVAAVNEENETKKQRLKSIQGNIKTQQYGAPKRISDQCQMIMEPMYGLQALSPHADRSLVTTSLRSASNDDVFFNEMPRKFKLGQGVSESLTKRELSILEGNKIQSTQNSDMGKKTIRARKNKQQVESKVIHLPYLNLVNNSTKKPYTCPNLVLNSYGVLENSERSCSSDYKTLKVSLSSTSSLPVTDNVARDTREAVMNSKIILECGSSRESGGLSNHCFIESETIRHSLHISTKDGGIGRSAGYFPPPSVTTRRDSSPKKQSAETRLTKCDAVDILDPTSSSGETNFPILIRSQRNHLGEMGTSMFGLTRTHSLPSVSVKLKRQKKRLKPERELISISMPILQSSASAQETFVDGIIGVNIESETGQETGKCPFTLPKENNKITHDVTQGSIIDRKTTNASIYRLTKLEKLDLNQTSRTISLEGQQLFTPRWDYPVEAKTSKLTIVKNQTSEEKSPNDNSIHLRKETFSFDNERGVNLHVSRQLYDLRSLCIESGPEDEKFNTIKQIHPEIRKTGAAVSNISALNSTPRTRPINASMSASRCLDEKQKHRSLTPSTESEDFENREDIIDLSVVCASKLKETPTGSTVVNAAVYNFNQAVHVHNDSITNSGSKERITSDFITDSDFETDISSQTTSEVPGIEQVRNPSKVAKHQGNSSTNPSSDQLTKLQIVTEFNQGNQAATVKILKSLDQDIYADFTHRKHRKKNLPNPSDINSKVVMVKVHYSGNDAANSSRDIIDSGYEF